MRRYFLILMAILLCLGACAGDDEKNGENSASDSPAGEKSAISASASGNKEQIEDAAKQGNSQAAKGLNSSSDSGETQNTGDKAKNTDTARYAYPAGGTLDPDLSKKADKLLAFSNEAQTSLGSGFYSLADALHENVKRYTETWRLPPKPKTASRKAARQSLLPPAGIFDEAEAEKLAAVQLDMDTALDKILEHYLDLEKYLADDSIQDNGKQGESIASKLKKEHASFMAARNSWLAIVEKRAAEAEAYLLQNHPLNRQIQIAGQIFAQMREIANFMGTESPSASSLSDLRQNVADLAEEAGRPPFPASPALEKDYRDFLKKVVSYCAILDRAIMEGLHAPQKKEVARAAQLCRNAYNEFARAVNQLADKGP